MTAFTPDLIAVHGAELVLKGHNRPQFEARLQGQIAARLKRIGLDWPVRRIAGRIVIEIGAERECLAAALDGLGEIPGIATFFPAMSFAPEAVGQCAREESPSNSPFRAAARKGEGQEGERGGHRASARKGEGLLSSRLLPPGRKGKPLLSSPLLPPGRKGELEGDSSSTRVPSRNPPPTPPSMLRTQGGESPVLPPAAEERKGESSGRHEDSLLTGPVGSALLDLARREHRPGARFAMRVARHDPALTLSTQSLERAWGRAILDETPWEGVNLDAPDCTFHVTAYPDRLLLYGKRRHGLGGLPVGSSGRVVALLSGGIDSPVAAFLMARRGCTVECLHFSANYLDRDGAAETPVGRLARQLSRYTQSLTLHVAPYVPFDLALSGTRDGYELMLFRRFMLRTAATLARRRRAAALVTGDSLSQVASQTLTNLVALDAAATLPVFRPLIGLNKQEIIARARQIGTYETSIEPYKDCCSLIGRHPKTRTQPERLDTLEAERIADYDALLATTLAETVTLRFEAGEPPD